MRSWVVDFGLWILLFVLSVYVKVKGYVLNELMSPCVG